MLSDALVVSDVKMAWGRVRHKRTLPKVNEFDTQACFVSLTFSDEASQVNLPTWPRIDKPGLISVQATDYGMDDAQHSLGNLAQALRAKAATETGLDVSGQVVLQTFPRLFGFVFNPVSFWFFHNKKQDCTAILCEVNNTFGERHFYLLSHEGQCVTKGRDLVADKNFHVSPFFPVSGNYRFRFVRHPKHSMARIDYLDGDNLQLSTSVSGQLMPSTTKRWFYSLIKYGWFTVGVVWKIHWQALKLWLKGAKFHTKPEPPTKSLTQAKVST